VIRTEGAAARVSDFILSCTGGSGSGFVDFTLQLNTTVTSRIVSPSAPLSDALLLVDDLSGGAAPGRNICQGAISDNRIAFRGVQFTDPGPSATRTFRITNIRVKTGYLDSSPAGRCRTGD
jgi:hypothetical protein